MIISALCGCFSVFESLHVNSMRELEAMCLLFPRSKTIKLDTCTVYDQCHITLCLVLALFPLLTLSTGQHDIWNTPGAHGCFDPTSLPGGCHSSSHMYWYLHPDVYFLWRRTAWRAETKRLSCIGCYSHLLQRRDGTDAGGLDYIRR